MDSFGRGYVHVDVSDMFTESGKYVVLLIWIVALISIWQFPRSWRSLVSISSAVIMVLARKMLHQVLAWGPSFLLDRALPLEPLVILVAVAVLKSILKPRPRSSILTSILGGALLFDKPSENKTPFLRILSALGSMVAISGNLHSLYIMALAYDEIPWKQYLIDSVLPVGIGLAICIGVGKYCGGLGSRQTSEDTQYQGISQQASNQDTESSLELTVEFDTEPSNTVVKTEFSASEVAPQIETKAQVRKEVVETPPSLQNSYNKRAILFAALTCFGYTVDGDVVLVTMLGVLVLFWIHHLVPRGEHAVRSCVQFESIFVYIGLSVITNSLGDTGLPQQCLVILLGICAGMPTAGTCLYRFSIITYVAAVIFSPLVVVISLFVTCPYFPPYNWIQIGFILGVANLTLNLAGSKWKWWPAIAGGSVAFLFLGAFLIETVHTSYECSVRLGER